MPDKRLAQRRRLRAPAQGPHDNATVVRLLPRPPRVWLSTLRTLVIVASRGGAGLDDFFAVDAPHLFF